MGEPVTMPDGAGGARVGRLGTVALGVCVASLVVGCAVALQAAWRWPMVGDTSLMRYVVFLLGKGWTPYAQIKDVNLPGSYLLEYVAGKCFGWDARGLRLYDGFLCLVLCVGSGLCGRDRVERIAGVAAGLLVVLVHLQDGVHQGGQRDFVLAIILVAAVAVVLRGVRVSYGAQFLFGLLMGCGVTIKPTLLPLVLLPLFAWERLPARQRGGLARTWLAVAGGFALPVAAMFAWLWRCRAVHAFVSEIGSIGRLHSELGRKGIAGLMLHCLSPIGLLFVLWVAMLLGARLRFDGTRRVLAWAMVCGLLSYIEQGKGLPYQRYPFLAAGVLLVFLDVSRVFGSPERMPWAKGLAVACVGVVALGFVPRFTWLVQTFDRATPFQDALSESLRAEVSQGKTVQCLDTYAGCINTLYDLRRTPATGYLYDCYLFSEPSGTREAYRSEFLAAFQAERPGVVVMTDEGCFEQGRGFGRAERWPEFRDLLESRYRVEREWHGQRVYRWWSRAEMPPGFRVLVLR